MLPHLWTGIPKVRPGAGIAVVGNPQQCAATPQQFIDAGCHSFCLSGNLHDEEAERFGRLVRPILAETIAAGWRRRYQATAAVISARAPNSFLTSGPGLAAENR